MDEKCRNCDEKTQACVPFFVHEGIMDHYSRANRRMLIALAVVCITFIITIVVFVTGYTQREKNWLDTLQRVGVTDGNGVHEQSDP